MLALPAAGLAGSKSSVAANFLNLPSTGTFICLDVAVTVLFAVSTWAWANADIAETSDAAETPAINQRETFTCFMYVLKQSGYWDESLFENQKQFSASRLWETGYQQPRINKLRTGRNISRKMHVHGSTQERNHACEQTIAINKMVL